MVTHKLMESKAEKTIYEFVNSAERTFDEKRSPLNEGFILGKIVEKGVHASFRVVGKDKPTNLFLDAESALRLFLGLRDSLRHVIETLSDEDKLHLQVMAERDKWGEERILGKKSHVAEDLGL